MPHTKQTHLPSFLTKGEVYQQMISEMEESGIEVGLYRGQFYSLWDLHFSHVIPQVRKDMLLISCMHVHPIDLHYYITLLYYAFLSCKTIQYFKEVF